MFATLVGTDTKSEAYTQIFADLLQIATNLGFFPGDLDLRVEPDQISLRGWSLELRGPRDKEADFLLAVTAPRAMSISPIPVRKTVSGPLFAVIVMGDFIGVWREGREFVETKDPEHVKTDFSQFLNTIDRRSKASETG